ncbi:MAG: phytanoyl-CoA dioxygenase family protein [Opitutales bacterium]|nr:phytanoyl-CoA dioxygenase family protein [Opitutales bacterium]NRA26712.1 phytanoyl-CoA dioxygenase family protein [Opitutales bacterium]
MYATNQSRLTSEQIEQYRVEGYVIPEFKVFSDEKFQALVDHFNQKLDALPKGERPEAMDTPHLEDPKLFEWALAPEVLDIVEPLIGPDIHLFSTHFICKPKGDGRRVPWHEDSAYWKKTLSPVEVATVWLALDPSTRENGCMKVIPKTHNSGHKGYSDYHSVDTAKNVFDTEILPTQRRDERAQYVELKPNQCSLHDARLMHGSETNTSNMRRCGWTLRFCPSSSVIHTERRKFLHMYPARGRVLTDQPLGDPSRAYPEITAARRASRIKDH